MVIQPNNWPQWSLWGTVGQASVCKHLESEVDREYRFQKTMLSNWFILVASTGSAHLYTVYNVRYSLYNVHYTLYNVHCTLYSVQCTLYITYSVHDIYSIHYIQCTIYMRVTRWVAIVYELYGLLWSNLIFHFIHYIYMRVYTVRRTRTVYVCGCMCVCLCTCVYVCMYVCVNVFTNNLKWVRL